MEPSNGAALTISKADISLREDLAAAIITPPQGHHLQGIIHASGVLADATIANQTLASLRGVFAPKVVPVGEWQEGIGRQPMALQVLFSSVAAMLGAPGQANYGTANAWLDSAMQGAQQQVRVDKMIVSGIRSSD